MNIVKLIRDLHFQVFPNLSYDLLQYISISVLKKQYIQALQKKHNSNHNNLPYLFLETKFFRFGMTFG